MSAQPAIAADWYSDPGDSSQLRWWDGSGWTEHVAPAAAPAVVEAVAVAVEPANNSPFQPVAEAVSGAEPTLTAVPDLPAEPTSPQATAAPPVSTADLAPVAAQVAAPLVAFPAVNAEVAAAPTQLDAFMEEDATRLADEPKARRHVSPKLLILILAAVIVGAGAWWFTQREPALVDDPSGMSAPAPEEGTATGALVGGDPAATDPTATDPAAVDPAAADPSVVDDATANGIAKAAEVAAGTEARNAAVAAEPAS